MEKKRPCYETRLGSIRVAIWENVTEGGATGGNGNGGNSAPRRWHNVSLTRRFKIGNQWKETSTFNGLGDLAQACRALQLAEQWITKRQETSTDSEQASV